MPEPLTMISLGGGVLGVIGHLARRYFDMAKEVFDLVASAILLLIASPIIVVCAAIIKLTSRGPAIFSQMRIGKGGKPFRIYKLRTMYTDAEKRSGAIWASDKDPRVVPACRWMRVSHVDELPQLFNILRGEMSLIGPRPEREEILSELELIYPNIRRRLTVKPGITGLAQIRDGYDTSIEGVRRKLRSDLEYIERRRWSLELRILAATMTKLNDRKAH
ncbi:MAG: sugar transferase [Phycisphaerae bacterium]